MVMDDLGTLVQVVLATYYSIPVVSFRAATWHPVWTRKEANFTVDDLMRDWHPNTRGHQCALSSSSALPLPHDLTGRVEPAVDPIAAFWRRSFR